ncbi:hypothetical protein VB735_32890 [Halotia wernerae UHCC 0503]|nr:hypothetical protein [Halotia wernerae UHCC 0503]
MHIRLPLETQSTQNGWLLTTDAFTDEIATNSLSATSLAVQNIINFRGAKMSEQTVIKVILPKSV